MKKEPVNLKENQNRSGTKPARSRASRVGDSPLGARVAGEGMEGDIIELILDDHKPLKSMIQTLKDEELDRAGKAGVLEEFVPLLTVHAKAEEQTLYSQMKEFPDLRMESFEGDTEHAIAAQLMQEINSAADDDEWSAKVKVLAELVETHIKEEEETFLEDVRERFDPVLRADVAMEYTRLKNEFDVLFRLVPTRRPSELNPRLN